MKRTHIGGQAVIEGVMMRGKKNYAVAVRDTKGNINIDEEFFSKKERAKILKLPLVRGVVAFIDSMITGYKILNKSFDMAGLEEEEELSKFEQYLTNKFGEKLNSIIIGISAVLGICLSVLLFMWLPVFLASFLRPIINNNIYVLSFFEGIIRFGIFLIYLVLISKNKDVKRLFKYHGAEHKTINTFEAEKELTVNNVREHSRFHNRCGTSFLVFVIIISMLFFMLVPSTNVATRLVSRIVFVPFIAGVSYEVLKWAGSSSSKFVKIVSYPGIKLQHLTTKEPDDDQIEVAIAAMERVLESEL
ncbi:MAG: DUF1385 domain-containing protein [Lachnospirales bacterium]